MFNHDEASSNGAGRAAARAGACSSGPTIGECVADRARESRSLRTRITPARSRYVRIDIAGPISGRTFALTQVLAKDTRFAFQRQQHISLMLPW